MDCDNANLWKGTISAVLLQPKSLPGHQVLAGLAGSPDPHPKAFMSIETAILACAAAGRFDLAGSKIRQALRGPLH
jgi:hypothetical protein